VSGFVQRLRNQRGQGGLMEQKDAIPRLVDAVVMPAVLDVCCGTRAFWFD